MKIKWYFVVVVIVFLLLVGGNIFKSRTIEKKELRIEQLNKDVIVYKNDIVNIYKENLVIFKDNKKIKKRFDKLKKQKEKIKVVVETKIIEVDKELYVPKKLYDNLSMNYDELAEEFSLCYVSMIKLELNNKKMQERILKLWKANKEKDDNKNDIIKIFKRKASRRISCGFGFGLVLTPDGKVYYGGTVGIQYRIF